MSNKEPVVWECYKLHCTPAADVWRELLEKSLDDQSCPYNYDIRGFSIRIWERNATIIKVPNSTITGRDGFIIERVAFDRQINSTLVGIGVARLYFEADSMHPTYKSTKELFEKGKYPPKLEHLRLIVGNQRLVEYFNSITDVKLVPHVNYTVVEQADKIHYHFENTSFSLARVCFNPGLSKNLLDAVRSKTAIVPSALCLGVFCIGYGKELNIIQRVSNEVVKVLNDWNCKVSLSELYTPDDVEQFINPSNVQPIVLFPLEGKKGDRPQDCFLQWIKYFSENKIGFQLFSTSSKPSYNRHGIAISILSKANGCAFTVVPDAIPNFQNSWFIGMDIGKGGQQKGKVLVFTLTSFTGGLKAYYRIQKNEDDTISSDALFEGLKWIISKAEEFSPYREIFIIHDGLRPKYELLENYTNALGDKKFTLIEYAKSGTPLIHCEHHQPTAATTLLIENSEFTAIYPCMSSKPKELISPVKFRVPINPNRYSSEDIAQLLTALCHSATLSYQPSRLPAPIYWADGIGGLSNANLQFAGWSHLPNRLVDLRKQ